MQLHLALSTDAKKDGRVIMNLRTVDQTGKIWVLGWIPLENAEFKKISDTDPLIPDELSESPVERK